MRVVPHRSGFTLSAPSEGAAVSPGNRVSFGRWQRTPAMDRTLEAAKAVVAARLSTEALSPLPASVRPQDVAEGYKIQDAVHEMLADTEWGRVVGYKIGCTTSVMQQ